MSQTLRLKLDLQWFAGEKTESATAKKRQDARKKGQVAKSMDLPAAFILLFSFLSFLMFGGYMKEKIVNIFRNVYENQLTMDITAANVQVLFVDLVQQGLIILAPIFILVVLVAFIGNYAQIGFMFIGDPLMMKFSKINPIEGFKRIFSLRTVMDFLKSTMKMLIIGYVVYTTLIGEKAKLLGLGHAPLESTFSFIASVTLKLGIKIGAILIVLAIFDFIYQKYEYEKSLKMSKQDIKDEYKKSEGDPLIKGKIRAKQRQMAMQRMMQEVPKADVIITNPTHFAVALKYDSNNMQAPTVIAKGADYVALKIKEVAKKNGIMTMENKPLARAIFAQVEIGDSIPAELFQAVAEVLAYVYKVKGKTN
ncbi:MULTISPECIES: flagellar biosynthesis protein FlhB [unclassified Paenibacillus]|uniref:flagellar biosynthesis protein FlhB n=1 Tax=unclassified Paenibacillus TaxID=185978 RepID=UPI00070B728C|nr:MULTISPECIES: flagellar biosynthesis protein FlhB [unclassified Paenibacillus]KQX69176.1 flagellar biosynthetic protein FlhB [Paenibacillus sp. Root444D2]KRE51722.1 flagellar biosynthetic protein FlhB [Paenibacillus sp. Soil724D2]